jgi:hypothetical protein
VNNVMAAASRVLRIALAFALAALGFVALWWLGFDIVVRDTVHASPGGPLGVGVILGAFAIASFSGAWLIWPRRAYETTP